MLTVNDKNSTAKFVVTGTEHNGKTMVYYFRSNRVKNPQCVWTLNVEKTIADTFKNLAKRKQNKTKMYERKLVVGDVLYSSGSYPDFYRVTKLVGKTSVKLEKLGSTTIERNWSDGRAEPDYEVEPEQIEGTFRVSSGTYVNFKENGWNDTLSKMTGKTAYFVIPD